MITDDREDLTAVVSEQRVQESAHSTDIETKLQVTSTILNALNEKRDAYNGVTTSIMYVIDSQDSQMNDTLRNSLIESITHNQMRYSGKMFISKVLNRLTAERPIFVQQLFERIIELSVEWSQNFNEVFDVLRIQILSLRAIKQAEQTRGGRPTVLRQNTIDHLCSEALFTCDDQTKIDALSLVLESRSTTKPLGDKELNFFKTLYQDALSLQEPSLRQILIALTSKMLKRMRESHRVILRDTKKFSDDERESVTLRYMNFLSWLISFCFNSIYCNAYFGSFILTISTLKLVIQIITFDNQGLPVRKMFEGRKCFDPILGCLSDSFEDNKKLALELLLMLPKDEKFITENLLNFEGIAYHLVGSVNPAHSLTCQYMFKLIIGLREKYEDPRITKNQLLLRYLSKLISDVEAGVKETNEDFLVALKHKPFYPKLTCIRALLDDVDIYQIEKDRSDWKKLAKKIVTISIEACRAVSTIVCNLNPETIGHLPMDLKPMDVDSLSKTLQISVKISDSDNNMVTSQMLLICGWKTVKECSLSMGSMCTRFWWPKEQIKMRKEKFPGLNTEPILDLSDITKILEFFDHYLRNLRHRGAFEQAYNGFFMVTKRIWHDDDLRALLTNTLHEIMNDFKGNGLNDVKKIECLKAYVTRRSAGLPFIVQAILNSEHKHDSKTLRWVMDSLFQILESENVELFQRIHCLNILRALIKEHFLGEKVITYVGKTFALTLESLKSDSFQIRNCANMLLKATVDRTFGVNRLRDDIHRRNQLSFERFFTECSNLHHTMLKILLEAAKDRECLAAVHAVFIVLFRLRPSLNPSEDFRNDKIIKPFIKPILRLAFHCPDYKLRDLAARLAVRLENFCSEEVEPLDGSIVHNSSICEESFQELDLIDQNNLHVKLSLMKYRIESDRPGAKCSIINQAQQLAAGILLLNQKSCSNSMKVIALDLIEACCLNGFCHPRWLINLRYILKKQLSNDDSLDVCFENLVFKFITVFLMGYFSNDCDENFVTEELDLVVDFAIDIILRQQDRKLSFNIQGSLIRFFRQILCGSNNLIDNLLAKLDLDNTAAHITPYDHLKQTSEQNPDLRKIARYCNQEKLRLYLYQKTGLFENLFKFFRYREFRAISSANDELQFSSKYSNNPRSIELLALAFTIINNEHSGDRMADWQFEEEKGGIVNKLNFLTQFIISLPDCDIKCLALLCAGEILSRCFSMGKKFDCKEDDLKTLESFTEAVSNLADGDHSFTIRESCSEVLRINLKEINLNHESLVRPLMGLLCALIKLSQDEEHQIRLSCQKVMLNLRDRATSSNNDKDHDINFSGSRLDHLIKLITLRLFNPNNINDTNNCIGLLIRIIFNQTNNYSIDVKEEKERLFDKTKLNTFADHVATIQSVLKGLETFLRKREDKSEYFYLGSLTLPRDILFELSLVDSSLSNETGDYSWRLKKVIAHQEEEKSSLRDLKSNQITEILLENISKSLQYFSSNAHWNMLTDAEYTHHELSLYKRIALLKFLSLCIVKTNPNGNSLLTQIKHEMNRTYDDECSTTLMSKCLDLVQQIEL